MPVVDGWGGETVDVAIVGAGAAGIAAARHLLAFAPSLTVMVLEAGARIGGRALTALPPALGVPVDLGCGWLHGARSNAWTRIAGELGFAVERTSPPWDRGGRRLGLSPDQAQACWHSRVRFFSRAEAFGDDEPDVPLSGLLEPDDPWNGFIGAIGTFLNGVELDRASVRDYTRYAPGPKPDWRVRQGYGRVVGSFGQPVPVVLDAAVTRIDHRAAGTLVLENARGTLQARSAIVTVPTDILAREAIRFDPPLPDHIAAAAGLPLGLADKLFLRPSRPEDVPVEQHLIGSAHRVGTGAYHLRPFGYPVIEGYYAGQLARDLERDGQAAAVAFATDELAAHLGNGIRGRLAFAAFSAWAANPFAGGSYSYARPGAADGRAVLAAPVDDRVFFAGEATSPDRFSTAHGAYESGVRAAGEVIAALGAGRA